VLSEHIVMRYIWSATMMKIDNGGLPLTACLSVYNHFHEWTVNK